MYACMHVNLQAQLLGGTTPMSVMSEAGIIRHICLEIHASMCACSRHCLHVTKPRGWGWVSAVAVTSIPLPPPRLLWLPVCGLIGGGGLRQIIDLQQKVRSFPGVFACLLYVITGIQIPTTVHFRSFSVF